MQRREWRTCRTARTGRMRARPGLPGPSLCTPKAPSTSSNMESQQQQQLSSLRIDDVADAGKRDWASLPLDLLRTIVSAPPLKGDKAAKRAALATCKALARAVVCTSKEGGLILDVDRRAKFAPSVQLWRELWGADQPQQGQNVLVILISRTQGSPGRCLSELLGAGERLPFVTSLWLKGLSLDVILAPGVSALLPNLRQLFLDRCTFTLAARTTALDAACSRLQSLIVKALSAQPQAAPPAPAPPPNSNSLQQLATAQLRQLAKLPSLSRISLNDSSCPTLFLVALGTQLTRLFLHETYRQCEPGTRTPTPGWRATVQHVARCTGLRELTFPCATAEELGLAAPALQQLRTLQLTNPLPVATDGDAVAELLLRLPHLTSLTWDSCALHTMRHWYNDRPCRWEQLAFGSISPKLLARLPLHSLKQPLTWQCLVVPQATCVRDVRAAVANVTRHCPAGFRWAAETEQVGPRVFFDTSQSQEDVPGVLRAMQPLFAPLTAVEVMGVGWDVARVRALGEVLPCTCVGLTLSDGSMSREAHEQVARSLPWLRSLGLRRQEVSPEDAVWFVRLARRLKGEEGGGLAVRLEEVVVVAPKRKERMNDQRHKHEWERAVREVREAQGGGEVVLKVQW